MSVAIIDSDKNQTRIEDSTLPEYAKNVLKKIADQESYDSYQITSVNNSSLGDNYLSSIVFAKICGVKKNEDSEEFISLIIKLPSTLVGPRNSIPVTEYFCREKFVYTEFLPELLKLQDHYDFPDGEKFHFAKCYAAISKCEEEILVLENLSEKQYKMFDRCQSADYDHTVFIIKNLAQFHALTFALKHKNHNFNENAKTYAFHKTDFSQKFPLVLEQCKHKAIDCIYDENNKEKLKNYCVNLGEKIYELLDLNDDDERPYNTFCHGDPWINNMLFKYQDGNLKDMIMVDWQMFKYVSPVTDLAYYLFCCTDEDLRIKHLKEFLSIYYSTLRTALLRMNCDPNICYPEEVFKNHMKEKMVFGLAISIVLVPLVVLDRKDADADKWNKSKDNVGFANAKYNDYTIERINGIVRDMIRLELL